MMVTVMAVSWPAKLKTMTFWRASSSWMMTTGKSCASPPCSATFIVPLAIVTTDS